MKEGTQIKNLEKHACPNCLVKGSLKPILWGMPINETVATQFIIGGCCPPDSPQDIGCTNCGWTDLEKNFKP